MRGLRAAVGLLTRVPVGTDQQLDTSGSIAWLPVVGGMIGLLVAGGTGYSWRCCRIWPRPRWP